MRTTHRINAGVAASIALLAASASAKDMDYRGTVDVRPASRPQACGQRELNQAPCTARGHVFLDRNRDGKRSRREPGVAGVLVSNGREVVRTNDAGEYELPVRAAGRYHALHHQACWL